MISFFLDLIVPVDDFEVDADSILEDVSTDENLIASYCTLDGLQKRGQSCRPRSGSTQSQRGSRRKSNDEWSLFNFRIPPDIKKLFRKEPVTGDICREHGNPFCCFGKTHERTGFGHINPPGVFDVERCYAITGEGRQTAKNCESSDGKVYCCQVGVDVPISGFPLSPRPWRGMKLINALKCMLLDYEYVFEELLD